MVNIASKMFAGYIESSPSLATWCSASCSIAMVKFSRVLVVGCGGTFVNVPLLLLVDTWFVRNCARGVLPIL